MEFAEQVKVKLDTKGRIYIPAKIRAEIGETLTIKKVPEGFLLVPSKKEDVNEKLRRVVESNHERTGTPEHWSPEKMKSIWDKSEG